MTIGSRPIRFLTSAPAMTGDPAEFIAGAKRVEKLGYSTIALSDHFTAPLAPLIALQAIADATSTLRLSQTVLDQDFRHPAVLAKELATLDVLSGGRLEVGIGAGWMQTEYEQAGIVFDKTSVRIERLGEVVTILKGLFDGEPFTFSGEHFTITGLSGVPRPVQHPGPPIMIGGGGPKLLATAGRQADIVQVTARNPARQPADAAEFCSPELYREKIDWIRQAAGARFDDLELGVQMLYVAITDDPENAVEQFLAVFVPMVARLGSSLDVSPSALRSSPLVAVGSLELVCDKLLELRDTYGFSYFSLPNRSKPELLAPVIERLAGA